MTAQATHKVTAEEKPIHAFLATSAAPPPPPPPPPPPAASSASRPTPQHIVKPVQIPRTSFVQPHRTPKEVPQVVHTSTTTVADLTPAESPSSSEPAGEPGGVAGGVSGGVVGGVQGGVVGGTVGGEVGGVLGGTLGGVVGGTVGGTGKDPGGEPGPPAVDPDRPVRVGGNVKAPVITKKVEPVYNEVARKAKVAGVVILEAIINKDGELEDVRVLKGLPMGLSESAEEAVKHWRFKPGTMNGEPVATIFNLTINFQLN